MKKLLMLVMGFMILTQSAPSAPLAATPDYEKYGKIAITVVQADYPGDDVTDYQYKGRKNLGNKQVEDDFVFVVVENGKEFNVIVTVQHDLENKKLLSLKVMEQKRK
ncbi:DUF3889 domain-containing protein [Peribacillus sp. NPDC097197]|uniref:DUF3889 domain-containing protein n=1 Tax=Peribacillus sp. NPDC097197 TaxID=3390615 RepID=UPI003D06E8EE